MSPKCRDICSIAYYVKKKKNNSTFLSCFRGLVLEISNLCLRQLKQTRMPEETSPSLHLMAHHRNSELAIVIHSNGTHILKYA